MGERKVLDLRPSQSWNCVSNLFTHCVGKDEDRRLIHFPMNRFRYSHGFLFPSEITRVRKFLFSYLDTTPKHLNRAQVDSERQHHLSGADSDDGQYQVPSGTDVSVRLGTPLAWAHSSVSIFGARYSPPIQDMSLWHSVEALVEGSDMSMLREGLLRSIFDVLSSCILTAVVIFRQSHDPRLCLGTQGRSKRSL